MESSFNLNQFLMRNFSPEGKWSFPPAAIHGASRTSAQGYLLRVRNGNLHPNHNALHYHQGKWGLSDISNSVTLLQLCLRESIPLWS